MNVTAVTYDWQLGEVHTLNAHKFDLATNTEVDRLSAKYKSLTKSQEELRVDVSSAIGLFQRKSEIGALESARLERCLADLLMLLVQAELSSKGKTILIQGPPFPKLIGRIGYRYPRCDLTIAFVSMDERFLKGGSTVSNLDRQDWDGPFPGYEEERITRRYFSRSRKIRVDLFAQGLGRYPLDYKADGNAIGVRAKLAANSENFLAFSKYLSQHHGGVQRKLQLTDTNNEVAVAARNDAQKEDKKVVPPVSTTAAQFVERNANFEAIPSGLEEAIFQGISTATLNTVSGQQRYATLRQFLDHDGIGPLSKNFNFLQYVELQIKEKRLKKTFVYSVEDLRRWYREFQQGNMF